MIWFNQIQSGSCVMWLSTSFVGEGTYALSFQHLLVPESVFLESVVCHSFMWVWYDCPNVKCSHEMQLLVRLRRL